VIVLPAMSAPQAASWHGLMDLHARLPTGWTLIGGQLVHLLCAERDHAPPRPTDDIDAVLDVRENPSILMDFTSVLTDIGFSADGISADGVQHRWRRDEASIDVLIPDGVGERQAVGTGVTGSRTVQTPGGLQALHRSASVEVSVAGREGSVRRPNLVGALVLKAAAHTVPADAAKGRHRSDFLTLATLVAAVDFRAEDLSKSDRKHLRTMIATTRRDPAVMLRVADAETFLVRLERAAGLA
jgi:hypothetical protein